MNRDEMTHVTDEDLLRMAHDARLTDPDLGEWMVDYGYSEGRIKKFAELVAAAEREACAQMCERMHEEDRPSDYAYSIRTRGAT